MVDRDLVLRRLALLDTYISQLAPYVTRAAAVQPPRASSADGTTTSSR
jgi:hypothetical protein